MLKSIRELVTEPSEGQLFKTGSASWSYVDNPLKLFVSTDTDSLRLGSLAKIKLNTRKNSAKLDSPLLSKTSIGHRQPNTEHAVPIYALPPPQTFSFVSPITSTLSLIHHRATSVHILRTLF